MEGLKKVSAELTLAVRRRERGNRATYSYSGPLVVVLVFLGVLRVGALALALTAALVRGRAGGVWTVLSTISTPRALRLVERVFLSHGS